MESTENGKCKFVNNQSRVIVKRTTLQSSGWAQIIVIYKTHGEFVHQSQCPQISRNEKKRRPAPKSNLRSLRSNRRDGPAKGEAARLVNKYKILPVFLFISFISDNRSNHLSLSWSVPTTSNWHRETRYGSNIMWQPTLYSQSEHFLPPPLWVIFRVVLYCTHNTLVSVLLSSFQEKVPFFIFHECTACMQRVEFKLSSMAIFRWAFPQNLKGDYKILDF